MSTETAQPIPPAPERSTPARSRRIWLVVAVVVVAGLLVWLLTRGDDDGDKNSATSGVKVGAPTILSESDLRAFGRAQPIPVYWAGPQPNRKYELTKTQSGRYYVRYLTPTAVPGDKSPRFQTVGTYPGTNAYGALQVVGRRPHTRVIRTQSGALVVYDTQKPTSVYFAFPGQNFQVELYDPRAERARRTVLGGKVERLR